ncbi:alkene reductase [Streptomyces sp. NPDC059897]|uniref:alkene reductase n=1 Tax=Streptomyces sp. NPDC059897 TaxID=3346994 RepID=UPI003663D3C4
MRITRPTAAPEHSRCPPAVRPCARRQACTCARRSAATAHSRPYRGTTHRSSRDSSPAPGPAVEPDTGVRSYGSRMTHTATSPLLAPYTTGSLHLPNRLVMAPMTRFRAHEDGTPLPVVAAYYAQRAEAGLLITEGIWPHRRGQSGWRIPKLETRAHIAGWRTVTEAVHARGGRIFAQLMHGGRQEHPRSRLLGDIPAGPSAVPVPGPVHVKDGKAPAPMPRAMTKHDIRTAIDDHVAAAHNALQAGFDGVELHGANSYLTHQFLADNTNLRTDTYGHDKTRFAVELLTALAETTGAHRLGLRLSPGNPQSGMLEHSPAPVYRALLHALNPLGLAYLHLTDNDTYPALTDLRPHWNGPLIANIGENHTPTPQPQAEHVLTQEHADLVSLGRAFLTHPDLPARIAANDPLTTPINTEHLYTHDPQGYTDYPTLEEQHTKQPTTTTTATTAAAAAQCPPPRPGAHRQRKQRGRCSTPGTQPAPPNPSPGNSPTPQCSPPGGERRVAGPHDEHPEPMPRPSVTPEAQQARAMNTSRQCHGTARSQKRSEPAQ